MATGAEFLAAISEAYPEATIVWQRGDTDGVTFWLSDGKVIQTTRSAVLKLKASEDLAAHVVRSVQG